MLVHDSKLTWLIQSQRTVVQGNGDQDNSGYDSAFDRTSSPRIAFLQCRAIGKQPLWRVNVSEPLTQISPMNEWTGSTHLGEGHLL